MKSDSNSFVWALAGAALMAAIIFLVLRFQSRETDGLTTAAKKTELVAQIRLAIATAAEAEKTAVLAITDTDSNVFAGTARAATATAEARRVALGALLEANGTRDEKESFAQFSKAFSDLKRVDKELLDLAVKNTNLKASALLRGPSAEAAHALDSALSHLLEESATSAAANAKKVMLLSAEAQAAALRIQVLLPTHIAEESDKKMDELEAFMAKENQQVQNDLKALAAITPAGNPDLATATSSYARFTDLRAQILQLSRENTNVRSLSISLNQKRAASALCEAALTGLDKAIEGERTRAEPKPPVRPR